MGGRSLVALHRSRISPDGFAQRSAGFFGIALAYAGVTELHLHERPHGHYAIFALLCQFSWRWQSATHPCSRCSRC